MYNLTAEQIATVTALHRRLIETSLRDRPVTLIHEHLDLKQAHSFTLFRCSCTENPDCTGFVLGIIECDTGTRIAINLSREQLVKFVGDVWKEIGTEVRQ